MSYKILGQSAPAATTATTLYTCPASTETVVSSVIICNRDAAADSFRIAVRDGGAALANEHYIAYDVPVGGTDSTALTLGLTLSATDVVTIYAGTANLSFSLFGTEETV